MCQIASFYAGAMSEAREIELRPVVERVGAELVLISADDPAAMLRHSTECRERNYRFAADPSQQLARMSGTDMVGLIDGAALLFTNGYEKKLLESKSGLTADQVLKHVEVQVTTLGKGGVDIVGANIDPVHVPIAAETLKADPTGVGDGFRAGFLTALSWGLGWERAAQVGSLMATLVLETVGTQEYEVEPTSFANRLAQNYGDDAAADVLARLI
jgi:adenosine kinase